MSFELKKTARHLNIHRRFLAMNSNEQVICRKLKNLTFSLINNLHNCTGSILNMGLMLLNVIIIMFLSLNIRSSILIEAIPNYRRTINSFTESDCWNFFETKKSDLPRLLRAWRIPEIVRLDNGSKMPGEEVMLRSLYELVSGEDQYNIAVNVFGRDQSQQSRALKWFLNHMYSTFQDLVTDNLDWWYQNGYLYQSMVAIRTKFGGNDLFSTCAFIDCNCLECCRPGGGPCDEGTDATRWDPLIQKAFYNGWKSNFGLKHQTVDCAYGMTIDLHGPWSLRRNDLTLLRESNINNRLRDLQIGSPVQLNIYGDSIYPRLSHLKSSYRHEGALDWMHEENRRYAKVRISIEWNYSITANLYKYLQNENKLKILGSNYTAKVYTVATIMRNCHVALYGSETSNYFDLVIPDSFLEKYMQVPGY